MDADGESDAQATPAISQAAAAALKAGHNEDDQLGVKSEVGTANRNDTDIMDEDDDLEDDFGVADDLKSMKSGAAVTTPQKKPKGDELQASLPAASPSPTPSPSPGGARKDPDLPDDCKRCAMCDSIAE